MKKVRSLSVVLIVAVLMFCFAACEQQPQHNPDDDVVEFSLVASDPDQLEELSRYANLSKLDLRGSTCYDAIMDYIAQHPEVEVSYDVALGSNLYDSKITELSIADAQPDFQLLLDHLKYLPNLCKLELTAFPLTVEQLDQFAAEYENIELIYSMMLSGTQVPFDVEQVDLSEMEPSELEQCIQVMTRLPNLNEILLMDADGESKLSMADVKTLMDALPHVAVQYSFELFGKTVTTADERVEFVRTEIGNEGLAQIRQALDILPNCTYLKLDRCGTGDKEMAKLREEYPNTKIVWRVFFAYFNCLTDIEMIHCTDALTKENTEVLKYCNDVLYLDIGHNTKLESLEFVSYMPKLKIAIVVDCAAETLEPFANCPDLEWLEIVNCHKISDLSPLANCTKLKGLNMSAVYKVKDLSPLFGLQEMERLYLGQNLFTDEQYEEACAALPNCWVTNTHESASNVSLNYAIGWRLDEDGSRAEWYKMIRKIFRYDENHYTRDEG